ncbi:MAG: hypothetical protein RIT24_1749 [Planctomycetota bacterium]|jgi:RNA polymerase sigma factor (TIGR02999 family)
MTSPVPDDFTVLLNRAAGGDGSAANAVWSRSYNELLAIARGVRPSLRAESVHAPSPTTIIHESFVKTFGAGSGTARADRPAWDSRAHFFGAVARAMSQFVIDWRRTATRQKRGGGERPIELGAFEEDVVPSREPENSAEDVAEFGPALAAALERLRTRAPEVADVVWLRAMAGLSLEDTAAVLGIRPRTVSKRWNLGRALLRREFAALSNAPD